METPWGKTPHVYRAPCTLKGKQKMHHPYCVECHRFLREGDVYVVQMTPDGNRRKHWPECPSTAAVEGE